MKLHEIFRVVSRFPRYISCYIAEQLLPLGQCTFQSNLGRPPNIWQNTILIALSL